MLHHGRQITLWAEGDCHRFALPDPAPPDETGPDGDGILAPMPGLVARLAARPGQCVTRGELLVVLEAMKMEHPLLAPRDGVVARVLVAAGDQVAHGALLLALEGSDG
jgi:3-methylcrotonyl-CoA carboxylase alpha subunit